MNRCKFFLGCIASLVLPSGPLRAQTDADRIDSLRTEVLQARHAGNLDQELANMILLAPLAGKQERMALAVRAGMLADSAGLPGLGAAAGRWSAVLWADAGNYRAAYSNLFHADSLERRHGLQELQRMEDSLVAHTARMEAQRDSLAQAAEARGQAMEATIAELQRRSGSWMVAAFAALITCVLLVLVLFYRMGRTTGRMRATIEALRAEVEVLGRKEAARAVARDNPPPAASGASAVDEAMKPVVAGMFNKDAPERLTTLRDARKRGDHDKVLRVVATMKPLLLSFDAGRFGPLVARLKAPGAERDAAQWNADLDALESALRELLARHRDQ